MYLPNIYLLCYENGESASHILIHSPFAAEVWDAMLVDFGMCWVMPQDVPSLLSSWPSLLSSWRTLALNAKVHLIWSMVPAAVW